MALPIFLSTIGQIPKIYHASPKERRSQASMSTDQTTLVRHKGVRSSQKSGRQIFFDQDFLLITNDSKECRKGGGRTNSPLLSLTFVVISPLPVGRFSKNFDEITSV